MDVDVINADGTGRRTLIGSSRDSDHSLVWSPNGRRVAFVSTRTDYSEVYVANAAGKKQKRLTGRPKVVTEDGARCTIVGTPKADVLVGTGHADVICGLGGDDTIRGGGGDDLIDGGPGDDRLDGNRDKDRVLGGPGADSIVIRDGVVDSADGGRGVDHVLADRDDWVRNAESIAYH
jgi:Ca2+-binding RTX toxin-like protein